MRRIANLILEKLRRYRRRRSYWKPEACHELHDLLHNARGVIHVGANKGQEAALYESYKLPVLWVEADPQTCEILACRLRDFPGQKAVSALLADVAGKEYAFHVASNGGQSSSLLKPTLHKEMWPEVEFTQTIPLVSSTLDQITSHLPDGGKSYDILMMDAQGAELLILQGGTSSLRNIRAIKTEASDFEAYEGCCTVATLDAWLSNEGFHRTHTTPGQSKSGLGSFYELYYEKAGT